MDCSAAHRPTGDW